MQPNTDTDRTATHRSEVFANELLTIARFNRPASAEQTRIAVIADPHLSPDAKGTEKLYHRGVDRLRRAFDDAEARGADAVISVGDLTKDGAPEEYAQVDDVLDGLDLPFLSVPGNHDVPNASTDVYEQSDKYETPPLSRFVEQYTPGEIPFHAHLGAVDLLGINTATTLNGELRESHNGKLPQAQVDWLDRKLPECDEAVVLMHHNLPQMHDQLQSYSDSVHPEMGVPPTMQEPEALVETLRRHDVPLVLTGHLHTLGVAEVGLVRELTVPATCSYPQGYVLLDIGPDGTTAKYAPVATTEGMTEAYGERRIGGETSQGLAAFSAIRLASAPLVDDWQD